MNEPSSMNHFQNQFVKNSVKSLPIGSSQWRKLLSMEWMWFFKSTMEFFFPRVLVEAELETEEIQKLSALGMFFFPPVFLFFSSFVFLFRFHRLPRQIASRGTAQSDDRRGNASGRLDGGVAFLERAGERASPRNTKREQKKKRRASRSCHQIGFLVRETSARFITMDRALCGHWYRLDAGRAAGYEDMKVDSKSNTDDEYCSSLILITLCCVEFGFFLTWPNIVRQEKRLHTDSAYCGHLETVLASTISSFWKQIKL